MSTQSNAMPESFDSQKIAPAAMSATRPLYWSVRRELWENRSIYIAPLIAAIVFLLGFFISMLSLRHRMHGVWPLDSAQGRDVFATRYELAAALIMGTGLIVGVFYTLDALYGERRDRSILLFDLMMLDHVDCEQLAALGDVRTPSIADLFVAVMGNPASKTPLEKGAAL